jgi:hypothetical protein
LLCSKKFLIEELDGSKVVARRKGITTVACTSAVTALQETRDFQFLSLREKARLGSNKHCAKAETEVCSKSSQYIIVGNTAFCSAKLGTSNAFCVHATWSCTTSDAARTHCIDLSLWCATAQGIGIPHFLNLALKSCPILPQNL